MSPIAMSLVLVVVVTMVTVTKASPTRTWYHERSTTSVNEPMTEYLQSIAWWSLASLGHDAMNLSGSSNNNQSERLLRSTRALFTSEQKRLLLQSNSQYHTALFQAVLGAAHSTKAHCKTQFHHERWDCADSGLLQRAKNAHAPFYGKLVELTTRQTAFLHALSAAALMSAVMSACKGGDSPCVCDPRFRSGPLPLAQIPREPPTAWVTAYHWGACSDNVEFGRTFVNQFFSKPHAGNDLRFLANKHNRELGMQLVENSIVTKCQCTDVTCQSKVCFRRQQPLAKIAEMLKGMFDVAKRVILNPYPRFPPTLYYPASQRAPEVSDMVYADEVREDDFCNANPLLGTPGTQKRICKPDGTLQPSQYRQGCGYICCGRGYSAKEAVRKLPDQFVLYPGNEVRVRSGKLERYVRYECN